MKRSKVNAAMTMLRMHVYGRAPKEGLPTKEQLRTAADEVENELLKMQRQLSELKKEKRILLEEGRANGLQEAADHMQRVVGNIGGPLFTGMMLTLSALARQVRAEIRKKR